MRVNRAVGRIEAGIGDAPGSHSAAVARDVLHQPVHGVVGIARFVDVFGRFLIRIMRPHVHEHPFGTALAAHILVHEDKALFDKLFRWSEVGAVVVGAIRGDRVRSPVQHDGILLGRIFRRVHRGEQPHAVPHRDQEFSLGVVGLDVVAPFSGSSLLGGSPDAAVESLLTRMQGDRGFATRAGGRGLSHHAEDGDGQA